MWVLTACQKLRGTPPPATYCHQKGVRLVEDAQSGGNGVEPAVLIPSSVTFGFSPQNDW